MFSTTTMASSTTKPTEMVAAISERLSRLKPATYMTVAAPSSDSGTTRARYDGDAHIAQEQEDHKDHEPDGEAEGELHVLDRSADRLGSVGENVDGHGRGDDGLKPRQRSLDEIDGLDHVCAGLLGDDEQDRRLIVVPGLGVKILRAVDGVADVLHPHRRPVSIGDYDVVIVRRLGESDRWRRW